MCALTVKEQNSTYKYIPSCMNVCMYVCIYWQHATSAKWRRNSDRELKREREADERERERSR